MPHHDIIAGAKLRQMTRQLMAERILIKLSVPQVRYEHLTIITDLEPKRKPRFFRIDPPPGAVKMIQAHRICELECEFTGRDGVIHSFRAEVQRIDADDIWLQYPKIIQRWQQRQNVRIEPGDHSILRLSLDDHIIDLSIENISTGGVLCTGPRQYKKWIKPEQQWDNVFLELALGEDVTHVTVARVEILRLSTDARPGLFSMAMKFCQVNAQNHRKLIQYINTCQRQVLQARRQSEPRQGST